MALKFKNGKTANFTPGFDMMAFGKLDFTMNFWIKIDDVDSEIKNILVSSDFEYYHFFLVYLFNDFIFEKLMISFLIS